MEPDVIHIYTNFKIFNRTFPNYFARCVFPYKRL